MPFNTVLTMHTDSVYLITSQLSLAFFFSLLVSTTVAAVRTHTYTHAHAHAERRKGVRYATQYEP